MVIGGVCVSADVTCEEPKHQFLKELSLHNLIAIVKQKYKRCKERDRFKLEDMAHEVMCETHKNCRGLYHIEHGIAVMAIGNNTSIASCVSRGVKACLTDSTAIIRTSSRLHDTVVVSEVNEMRGQVCQQLSFSAWISQYLDQEIDFIGFKRPSDRTGYTLHPFNDGMVWYDCHSMVFLCMVLH